MSDSSVINAAKQLIRFNKINSDQDWFIADTGLVFYRTSIFLNDDDNYNCRWFWFKSRFRYRGLLPCSLQLGFEVPYTKLDWRFFLYVELSNYPLIYCAISKSSNSILNKLFKLPSKQLSILNLAPLVPPPNGLELICQFEYAGEQSPFQSNQTLRCKQWRLQHDSLDQYFSFVQEACSIWPIELLNITSSGSGLLLDFVLIETRLDRFDDIVDFHIEIYADYRSRSIIFSADPNLNKAVLLGQKKDVNLFAVPLIAYPAHQMDRKKDFINYFRHVQASLSGNQLEPQFTSFISHLGLDVASQLGFKITSAATRSNPIGPHQWIANLYLLHHF
jgi:hypothetical protein